MKFGEGNHGPRSCLQPPGALLLPVPPTGSASFVEFPDRPLGPVLQNDAHIFEPAADGIGLLPVFGIPGIKLGKHNLKDPRLDQAHELVEADKKVHAQVDVVGEEEAKEADAIIVAEENCADLILHDLEFIDTRLGRNPEEAG